MKTLNYIILLLALIGSVSCSDFLEEVPRSVVAPENYYVDAKGAEGAVVGAYNAMQRQGYLRFKAIYEGYRYHSPRSL